MNVPMPQEKVLRRASALADRCAEAAGEPDEGRRDLQPEFSWIAEAGLLAVPLPRDHGGLGWGTEPGTWHALLRLLKIIGRGNLSVGRIYEGHINALQLILQWGTPEQIAQAAEEVSRGLVFGVWNTEAPGDGVALEPLEDGARWRMRGAKTFASGASVVQRVFANARLPDGGWQMWLVPMDEVQTQHDLDSWQPIGMRATTSIRVDFTGVELGREALFGSPGDYTQEPWFSGGAIRFAAVQLGGAEAIAEAARTFLQGLARGDDPYQAQRMGEMTALLETGNLWLQGAAACAERAGDEPAQLVAYAALLRRTVERIGLEVMEHAVRSAGARALLRPQPLERLVRDLTMYLRQPAPDEVLARAGKYAGGSTEHFDTLWRK